MITSGVSLQSHSSSSTASTTGTMSTDSTESPDLVSTESPYSPSSGSPLYSHSMPFYSPSMLQYSQGSPESAVEYAPTKKRRLHSDTTKPKFPPPPVDIPIQKSRNKYDFCFMTPYPFCWISFSFLHGEDSKYASRMRKRALQIVAKPDDISYCVDGHVLSTMETVKTEIFFYEMSTTFKPLPTKKRFESTARQTDVQTSYCEAGGRVERRCWVNFQCRLVGWLFWV